MELNPEDLAKITDFTLSHYNEHAEDFWEGTRDHNVKQNITALLQSIEGEPPYTILGSVLSIVGAAHRFG
jgi:hypothetical protein